MDEPELKRRIQQAFATDHRAGTDGGEHRRLYELVTADGASISPFVWRTKFALAFKDLDYQSLGLGYTDIPDILDGRFRTLPVLKDGAAVIGDSWAIAEHLEGNYPETPRLFGSPAEHAFAMFFEEWMNSSIRPLILSVCALDIYNRLKPADQAYFRSTREKRLAARLEVAAERRNSVIPRLREALQPLRCIVAQRQFLGGDRVTYADFIGFGFLIWAGSVASVDLLSDDDPILEWLEHGFALFERPRQRPADR